MKHKIEEILRELEPYQAELVAVSKTKPVEVLRQAYDFGLSCFGENKVQELCDKEQHLPEDIDWHMIGHLQTNKVKMIVPFVGLIQSVDSQRLLTEINKRAAQVNRVVDCLCQVHIAQEETKFGFSPEELWSLLNNLHFANLPYIRIVGLMGMASNTQDQNLVRQEFRQLRLLFDEVSRKISGPQVEWMHCSMGMSNDYMIALEEGSTMVRIGSALFGSR
jgi:pyridoxal phosphate enzyme (YggS family)